VLAIICIFISIIMGAAGQLFIKQGLNNLGGLDFSTGLVSAYMKIFLSPLIFLGILIYFLGVFFWLYGLSKVDLSFAFPFVSLSYVFVFLFSWWFLGENIPLLRWIGVLTICLGVFLVAKS
jgi:drug/metabolite transporter (DMT)-like permease